MLSFRPNVRKIVASHRVGWRAVALGVGRWDGLSRITPSALHVMDGRVVDFAICVEVEEACTYAHDVGSISSLLQTLGQA
jgi:hypothetical protein